MKWKTLCLSAALTAVLAAAPAYALDYTVDAPEDYLFGRPTSVETVTEYGADNVDRSKNTALDPARLWQSHQLPAQYGRAPDAQPDPRCPRRRAGQLCRLCWQCVLSRSG